jgi:glutathione synthase/RimK-type ligase-like ATP-grasp enzyme
MIERLRQNASLLRLRKTPLYARLRQYFPMAKAECLDDRSRFDDAELVSIDWPSNVTKPRFGIVRDCEEFPRWTKYCRFLDNNSFGYDICDIHAHDWIENVRQFDIVVGFVSCWPWDLEEVRKKYLFLEKFLGIATYPSPDHAYLYEDKILEVYISEVCGIPYAKTHVSHDKDDALRLIQELQYPVVSKIVPASGSVGVELITTPKHARRVVEHAFSTAGRKSHMVSSRQKNYIYFQDFVPNDGYDIRVMVIGNWAFGYYRRAPEGDFRASGMHLVEKRELPEEAMKIALDANKAIRSPMLVVDMLHGLDGKYYVIEISPVCRTESPEQLHVDGIPGVYIFEDDGSFRFEPGKYWVHELALREFLLTDYLKRVSPGPNQQLTTPSR